MSMCLWLYMKDYSIKFQTISFAMCLSGRLVGRSTFAEIISSNITVSSLTHYVNHLYLTKQPEAADGLNNVYASV